VRAQTSSAHDGGVTTHVYARAQCECNHIENLLYGLARKRGCDVSAGEVGVINAQLDAVPAAEIFGYARERRIREDQATSCPGQICFDGRATLGAGIAARTQHTAIAGAQDHTTVA
jgi:hypothetical protein